MKKLFNITFLNIKRRLFVIVKLVIIIISFSKLILRIQLALLNVLRHNEI